MFSVGICGAGVAGLTFAQALHKELPEAEISLFDLRPRLPHPIRTFGVFSAPGTSLPAKPAMRWSHVAFQGPLFRRSINCSQAPYTLIHGCDFFEALLTELEASDMSFHWGCNSVRSSPRSLEVNGKTLPFDLVVDASFDPRTATTDLWQSFAGIWVRSPQPAFDPDTALLMDLAVAESQASVRFVYLLPTSQTTALIEHTVFAVAPPSCDEHLTQCHEWADANGYRNLEVTQTEFGRIPMGLHPLPQSDPYPLRIGTRGGALRASTGYAFLSTINQAQGLARSVALAVRTGSAMPSSSPAVLPSWMRLGDALFVRALSRSPSDGQGIMNHLLRYAPDDDLIPFLSGGASLSQALRVMLCVPKLAMLRALL